MTSGTKTTGWIAATTIACALSLVLGCGDDDAPATTADGTTANATTTGTTTSGGGTTTSGGGTTSTGGSGTTSTTGDTGTTTGGDEVCTPGEKFCNGSTLFTCKADGSELESLLCDFGCQGGQCKTGCVPNESVCKDDGKTLVTCDPSGNPSEEVCSTKCTDGACAPEICTPDAIVCEAGGNKLVKCAPDGLSAETFDVCPYGCTEGEAECDDAVCDNNETQCSPDEPLVVQICNDKQNGWVTADSECKEECVEGECKVSACQVDEAQCGPLGVEECNADKTGFDLLEICKSGCLTTDDGPVCAKCKEGLVQCDGLEVQECDFPLVGFVTKNTCSEIQACAGGSCLDVVVLDEATWQANYLLLFKAFLACFEAGVEGKCSAIDATSLGATITADLLKDWWCENKEGMASSFADEAEFELAADMGGQCGTFEIPNEQDFDFEEDIVPGQADIQCLGFSTEGLFSNPNNKEIVVKACDLF